MGGKQKIEELFNELKGLLANYPNNRVDFEFEKNNICCFDGEEWQIEVFSIYSSSSLDDDEELIVKSIYVEDDKLYFDCFNKYDDWEEIICVWENKLYNRTQDTEFLIDALEFFVDILKK